MDGFDIYGFDDDPYGEAAERESERLKSLPLGLCADKLDHAPHDVLTGSLAPFCCTADQSTREPYRSETRRKNLDESA